MRVCVYACMRVCMYACMRVCMYACMRVCVYACMRVLRVFYLCYKLKRLSKRGIYGRREGRKEGRRREEKFIGYDSFRLLDTSKHNPDKNQTQTQRGRGEEGKKTSILYISIKELFYFASLSTEHLFASHCPVSASHSPVSVVPWRPQQVTPYTPYTPYTPHTPIAPTPPYTSVYTSHSTALHCTPLYSPTSDYLVIVFG